VFPGGSVKAKSSAVAAGNKACLVPFQPQTPPAFCATLRDTSPRGPLACGLLHASPLAATPGAAEGRCRNGQHHRADRSLLTAAERAQGAMAQAPIAGELHTPFSSHARHNYQSTTHSYRTHSSAPCSSVKNATNPRSAFQHKSTDSTLVPPKATDCALGRWACGCPKRWLSTCERA